MKNVDNEYYVFFTAQHLKDRIHSFVIFSQVNEHIISMKTISLNTSTKVETIMIRLYDMRKDSERNMVARMNNHETYFVIKENERSIINLHFTVLNTDLSSETPEEILNYFGINPPLLQPFSTPEEYDNCMCMDWCSCYDKRHDRRITKDQVNELFGQIFNMFEKHMIVNEEFYDSIVYHGFVNPPFNGNLLPSLAYVAI